MQEPLQFEFQGNQIFESFYPGYNAEIIHQLRCLAGSGLEQQVYVWGEAGCGKTHLLHACCQLAKSLGEDPFYLDLGQKNLPDPELLEGLELVNLVCLDNLQSLEDQSAWQLALFNFYNQHRQNNHHLLLAADCPPKFLPFALLDLKTRMSWGLTLKIQSLREDQLIEALSYKARYLGFDIPAAVGRFLLNHYVHDLPALWRLLEKIDRATLVAKHKLTVPFLKKILDEQL